MAEAFAAIAVVSSVITCIDFAGKLVVETIKFTKSSSDTLPDNKRLSELTQENEQIASQLRSIQGSNTGQALEQDVQERATQCQRECTRLLDLLGSLKANKQWKKIAASLRSKLKQPELEACRARIQDLRDQASLALLRLIQSDQRHEFRSLKECIEKAGEQSVSTLHQAVNDIAVQIRKLRVTDVAIDQVLNSLEFPDINRRRYDIDHAASETFQWPLRDSPLAKWLSEGSGLFWIRGKVGSGKSTLMKHITEDCKTLELLQRWTNGGRLVVADHFFSILGSSMQKSYQGLLQTLLYKIFVDNRSFIPIGCPDRCNPAAPRSRWSWSIGELFDCLSAIFEKTDAHFCLFIDSLDEYCPQDGYAKLIKQLMDIKSRPNVKMCISSRNWAVFENAFGQSDQQIRLEAWTKEDIRGFVSNRLLTSENTAGHHHFGEQDFAFVQFIEEFLHKADGVFIWARLVCSSMCDRLLAGKDLSDLRRCLDEFPGELEQYLRKLVYDRINSTWLQGQRSETAMALKLATIMQSYKDKGIALYWLILICTDHDISQRDFYKVLRVRCVEGEDSIVMHDNTKRILDQACKDILKKGPQLSRSIILDRSGTIDRCSIEFSHRSMYDFLMTPEMQTLLNKHVPSHFLEDDFMLRLGIAYTKLQFPSAFLSRCESNLGRILNFIDQSTLNLIQDIEPLRDYERSVSDHAHVCERIFCSVHHREPEGSPWSRVLHLLVRHGLYETMRTYTYLRSYPGISSHTYLWTAFGTVRCKDIDYFPPRKIGLLVTNMDIIPSVSFLELLLDKCEYNRRGLGLFARQWALWRLRNGGGPTADNGADSLWRIAKLLLDRGAVLPDYVCMNEWSTFDDKNPDACFGRSWHLPSPVKRNERYHFQPKYWTRHNCVVQSVETLLRTCVPPAHLPDLERMLERARNS